MSKTAELLCQLTSGVNVRDQWRTPEDDVVALVMADENHMKQRAELLAGAAGRCLDGETFYSINGLTVAVSSSTTSDLSYIAVSTL